MKKKKIIITILVVLVIAAVTGGFAMKNLINQMDAGIQELKALEISNVDLTTVNDGTYTGIYKVPPIEVELNVTVKDRKITNIDIVKHDNGKGTPAEEITSKVIEAQSLEVDEIAGATYSSKVILKAIEQALIK